MSINLPASKQQLANIRSPNASAQATSSLNTPTQIAINTGRMTTRHQGVPDYLHTTSYTPGQGQGQQQNLALPK